MTVFLVITLFAGFPVKSQDPIIIGVINAHGWPQGDSIWNGANMAKDKVNAEGGILGHLIELIDIDEHAVDLRPELAWEETLAALEAGAQFLVGGFRSEVCFPLREDVMDYAAANGRPIWWVTGAATDELIDCGGGALACGKCVRCQYERYKYMFRITPMNSTTVVGQLFAFVQAEVVPRLVSLYGDPVKTYIIMEDLISWDKMYAVTCGADLEPEVLPGISNPYPTPPAPGAALGEHVTIVGRTRPSQFVDDLSAEFAEAESLGARLIFYLFSAVGGVTFSKQYGELEVPAVIVGVNVEGQLQTFWDTTFGYCEYESFLNSMGTATPIVPGVTDKFWRDYNDNYGGYPVYTGFAAYDAIIALDETIEAAGTWPLSCDELIPLVEPSERLGILGNFKYTGPNGKYHDVWVHPSAKSPASYGDPPYVRGLLVQWQAGRQEAIWPSDRAWSKQYALPPWMYADYVQDPGDDSPFADVTYDGSVDIFDIVTISGAFGQKPGGPLESPNEKWNARADVKKDGSVDIFDIVTAAADFGESITLPIP